MSTENAENVENVDYGYEEPKKERDFSKEPIIISPKVRQLCRIGTILQNNYFGNETEKFTYIIRKNVNNKRKDDIVSVEMQVGQLLDMIDKLGRRDEYGHSDFNKNLEECIPEAISKLKDIEVIEYLIGKKDKDGKVLIEGELPRRKRRIYELNLLEEDEFIEKNGLNITNE